MPFTDESRAFVARPRITDDLWIPPVDSARAERVRLQGAGFSPSLVLHSHVHSRSVANPSAS